jgi:hypothetical protein
MEGIAEELAEQGRCPKAFRYEEMNDNTLLRKRRVVKANKRPYTDVRTVATICEAFGYDPIESVINALQGDELSIGEKVRTAMGLAEYIHPKLGRLEHTGSDGGPLELTVKWRAEK